MKAILRSIFCIALCLLSVRVFAADIGTYKNYQDNVRDYCGLEKPAIPNADTLWDKWKDQGLIALTQFHYADLGSKSGDSDYKAHLSSIGSDPSKITAIDLTMPTPNHLQKASYVYTETMGAIYACAVLNAKKRIIHGLMDKIGGQSNIKRDLQKQVSSITSELSKRKCRDISGDTTDNKELSIKGILLDNTMYQYCNYRFYLHYLDHNARNSANTFFQNPKSISGVALLSTTDQAAAYIREQWDLVSREIRDAREIYPQALVAYSEFERTYASHILLTVILQDYIDLRDTIKQVMNPIGQVIYKASNAQSPGQWAKP